MQKQTLPHKKASQATLPLAWQKFRAHLEACDNEISNQEMDALQAIFTEAESVAPRDYRTCFRLFEKCNGILFEKNTKITPGTVPFTDLHRWRHHARKESENSKRKIYRYRPPLSKLLGGELHHHYVVKAYSSPQVATINVHEDFKREVLYGGFIAALRPDLYAGMRRYHPAKGLIMVPEVPGKDGFYYVAKNPTMEDRRIVSLNLITACRALHNMGFIHSDIKLENIMVDTDTLAVKLIDFEHVSLVDTQRPVKRFFGTYSYCMPLMYATSNAVRVIPSKWTDIYAAATSILILMFEIGLTDTNLEDLQLLKFNTLKAGQEHPDVRHVQEHQKRQQFLRQYFEELRQPVEEAVISTEFAELFTDIIAFDQTMLVNRYKTPENLWKELWQAIIYFTYTP